MEREHETVETAETFEEECMVCGGVAQELGTLGSVLHYRCRDCGIIFS